MTTLDSLLPELRSLLPASLRGEYLDGYLQRERTRMELLLSRSLPNVDVAASTFDDVRSEIRALGMPQWVANRYLAEAEQALADGQDTREVVARAKAWMATSVPSVAEPDACHVCAETGTKSCTACGTEIVPYGAHGDACPKCAEQEVQALDTEDERGMGVGEQPWSADERRETFDDVSAFAAQEEEAEQARANLPKMQRLRMMAASPPSDLSGWSQRITDLYGIRMRPEKKLFGSRGPTPAQRAEYDAEKKLWESLNRKARAEHKRLLAISNAGFASPPPKRPALPDPVLTRTSGSAYRSEADTLADIFNEEGIWQAEPVPLPGRAEGVRLSIYSEQRGHTFAVALATLNDNDVDVEWLSPTLTLAQRNEITRRLRTAALTQSEDSEAPSPLQDLIEITEKRALELGAKPARTRSLGRVTSENPEERRLEAVRDLRDRSELDEAIKWLEDSDLNLDFDIGERTLALDSVDKLMTEIWGSILDTASIDLGGVRGEGRGAERFFYVSPDMIFDATSMPFLMEHVKEGSSISLRQVFINVIDPGDGDSFSAKVLDRQRVLTNDSRVHVNERGAHFIRSLYRHMKSLRDDLSRAPKALDDVRKLLYWTGAMLDTPRCQDETHSRALESFEAAKVVYDQVRQHVVVHGTTSSELASIKAPLRKAAVSAAKLATDCGEGQVDIFSVRQPESSRQEPPPVPPESPETPLHQQDPNSVDVLDRLVAALSEVFIVTPIRSGHGYRVVDLRSSVDFGVYKGLPRNTYLTTVSLRHSGPSEIIGDKAFLFQSTRDAGLSQDQFRAIRRFVAETVERLTDEAQGKAPPEPEAADDSEVTTKTFATRMPTKYLRNFFSEKDIPEVHWTLRDSSGMEHHISNLVVVEHITQINKTEAEALANNFRKLDFENRDINGYLRHLAHALIEHKVSSVQDSDEPAEAAVDAPPIFVAFSHPIPPRLAAYYKAGQPGDPARFADLPVLPDKKVREQMAAINSLPRDFAEALQRYMGIIADLNMENTASNQYGVWQTPAVFAEVGPANVKIVRTNRGVDGHLAEHVSIHTLVRRKDGAILKFGAPPASAVRGNIYRPEADIRMSINYVASISRR